MRKSRSLAVVVDSLEVDSVYLHNFLGELQLHSCINMLSQLQIVCADLLDFAAPEVSNAFRDRKNHKTAAKIVGRQNPRKQLVSDSRRLKGAWRWKAAKQSFKKFSKLTSRSRRDFLIDISP